MENFSDDCVNAVVFLHCDGAFSSIGSEALLSVSTHHRGPFERLQAPQGHRHLGGVCVP